MIGKTEQIALRGAMAHMLRCAAPSAAIETLP